MNSRIRRFVGTISAGSRATPIRSAGLGGLAPAAKRAVTTSRATGRRLRWRRRCGGRGSRCRRHCSASRRESRPFRFAGTPAFLKSIQQSTAVAGCYLKLLRYGLLPLGHLEVASSLSVWDRRHEISRHLHHSLTRSVFLSLSLSLSLSLTHTHTHRSTVILGSGPQTACS